MMDLAREVFETLQRDIISLKRVIVRAYLVDSNAAAMGIYLPDNQLSSIRAGILQMLQILELVQHVERSGQGGAINALFAKEYFVNDNNHDPGRRSFDNHDKLDRIVVERNILVGNIMERMLSDDPSEAIQRLG